MVLYYSTLRIIFSFLCDMLVLHRGLPEARFVSDLLNRLTEKFVLHRGELTITQLDELKNICVHVTGDTGFFDQFASLYFALCFVRSTTEQPPVPNIEDRNLGFSPVAMVNSLLDDNDNETPPSA